MAKANNFRHGNQDTRDHPSGRGQRFQKNSRDSSKTTWKPHSERRGGDSVVPPAPTGDPVRDAAAMKEFEESREKRTPDRGQVRDRDTSGNTWINRNRDRAPSLGSGGADGDKSNPFYKSAVHGSGPTGLPAPPRRDKQQDEGSDVWRRGGA